MYVRRKVFSCQRSMNDLIAEIEERAFSEGYESALLEEERFFASVREMKKKSKKNFTDSGGCCEACR